MFTTLQDAETVATELKAAVAKVLDIKRKAMLTPGGAYVYISCGPSHGLSFAITVVGDVHGGRKREVCSTRAEAFSAAGLV